jgi:hypothetical protein
VSVTVDDADSVLDIDCVKSTVLVLDGVVSVTVREAVSADVSEEVPPERDTVALCASDNDIVAVSSVMVSE